MHHVRERNLSLIYCWYLNLLGTLSINRFCSDNHVRVEFDKQRVKIRDLATEKVLAEEKDGTAEDP